MSATLTTTPADTKRIAEIAREGLNETRNRPTLVPAVQVEAWADQITAAAGDDALIVAAADVLRDACQALTDEISATERCASKSRAVDALLDILQLVS